MKKIITLTIILIILFNLFSCNNTASDNSDNTPHIQLNLYSPLVTGYSDSLSSNLEVEYKFASPEDYSAKNVKDSIEIEINGIAYSGKYDKTSYIGYNYFPVRKYVDNKNNPFAIDDNGTLTSYFWGTSNSKKHIINEDECIKIAKNFLSNMVDITEYEINIVENKEKELYSVKFKKIINGFETADCATVNINYDGSMYSYSSFMLGKIPNDINISDVDIDKVNNAVKNRLNSICEDLQIEYDEIRYDECSIILTILKEKYIGFVISYEMDCINKIGEFGEYEQHFDSIINFAVPVKNIAMNG